MTEFYQKVKFQFGRIDAVQNGCHDAVKSSLQTGVYRTEP
tara:strand:- start:4617 stop:4736 length:120 start_codon:yes stop_codon:yes gene_type:complete